MNMPKDAFAAKDWWGGWHHDGRPDSDRNRLRKRHERKKLQPESRQGRRDQQWRDDRAAHQGGYPGQCRRTERCRRSQTRLALKASNFTDYLLAQYTLFWHNGACYDNPNWSPTPNYPVNPKPHKGGPARAAGSADPTTNTAGITTPATTTTTTYTKEALSNLLTSTSTNKTRRHREKSFRRENPRNANGTVTITTTNTYDANGNTTVTSTTTITLDPNGAVYPGPTELRGNSQTGRVSWREFFKD